jgi:hypothetical protein
MPPPQPPLAKTRAPKAPTLREADWEPVKPYILQYLMTKPLREVRVDIEAQFGFKATYVFTLPNLSSALRVDI